MDAKPIPVIFATGADTEHLAAELAVAAELKRLVPDVRTIFAAAGNRIPRAIAASGHETLFLRPGADASAALRTLTHRWSDYHVSRRCLRDLHAAAVVTSGEGPGVPLARAAARQGVPLVLLEPNVVPGSITRSLARWATLVCVGFEESRSELKAGCPIRVTGAPVAASYHRGRWIRGVTASQAKRLLILGDRTGAIDTHLPEALYKVRRWLGGWKIVHQTASRRHVAELYRQVALPAMVAPRLSDPSSLVVASDLVVTHGDGPTLAAIAAAGAAAVVVADAPAGVTQQSHNACKYGAAGACVTVLHDTAAPLGPRLPPVLESMIGNPDLRRQVSRAAAQFIAPDAAWRVATMIRDLLRAHRRLAA